MSIYIAMFFLMIVLYIILCKKTNGMKVYCIIIGICLALIAGLRNENLGLTDTKFVYKVTFNKILNNNNFEYVLTIKDTLFQILTYIYINIFGDNFKLYVLLFTCPYIASVSFFIYKYSNKKWLSFIVFMCLHYFEISFTLMRQINGMAILLVALHYLIKEKKIKFVFFTILASCFHTVCIIFLVLLPISKIKMQKKIIILILIVLTIFVFYSKEILNIFYSILKIDRFLVYQNSDRVKNRMFFYINLVLWIFEMINYRNIMKDYRSIFLWSSTICLLFSPLTVVFGEASRISYVFGLVHVVLLTDTIDLIKDKKQKIFAELLVAFVLLIYFVIFLGPQVNIIPYKR